MNRLPKIVVRPQTVISTIDYDVGITWLNGPITDPEFPS